jgi:hypothetical protein
MHHKLRVMLHKLALWLVHANQPKTLEHLQYLCKQLPKYEFKKFSRKTILQQLRKTDT